MSLMMVGRIPLPLSPPLSLSLTQGVIFYLVVMVLHLSPIDTKAKGWSILLLTVPALVSYW